MLIGPDARDKILDRMDNVQVAVIAYGAVRPLGGGTDNRHRCVDQKVQPVNGLLNIRAPFQPYATNVFTAPHRLLYGIRQASEVAHGRIPAEMGRLVDEKIPS